MLQKREGRVEASRLRGTSELRRVSSRSTNEDESGLTKNEPSGGMFMVLL